MSNTDIERDSEMIDAAISEANVVSIVADVKGGASERKSDSATLAPQPTRCPQNGDGTETAVTENAFTSELRIRSKKRQRITKRRTDTRRNRVNAQQPTVGEGSSAANNHADVIELDLEALTYYPPPGARDPHAVHVNRPAAIGDEEVGNENGKDMGDATEKSSDAGQGARERRRNRTEVDSRYQKKDKEIVGKMEDKTESQEGCVASRLRSRNNVGTRGAEASVPTAVRRSKRVRDGSRASQRSTKRSDVSPSVSASGSRQGKGGEPVIAAVDRARVEPAADVSESPVETRTGVVIEPAGTRGGASVIKGDGVTWSETGARDGSGTVRDGSLSEPACKGADEGQTANDCARLVVSNHPSALIGGGVVGGKREERRGR